MPEAAIQVRVLRRGARGDELLRQLGQHLERAGIEPDAGGVVWLRLPHRGPQAWDRVRDTLDSLGADWREWLHLAPRPKR